MAAASFALTNNAENADTTYTLVGATSRGAEYKDATQELSTPRTLKFIYNIGEPGSKAHDRLSVVISKTGLDADGVSHTGSVKVELSIPRCDTTAWPASTTEDLLANVADLLGVKDATAAASGQTAIRIAIANGMVPEAMVAD